MGAPNFKACNTSKIFIFGTNKYYTREDVEANEFDEKLVGELDEFSTQMDFEESLYNCKGDLLAKGWEEAEEHDGDISYPAQIFARKRLAVQVAGVSIDVALSAKAVSGYCEGATFDYEAEFEVYERDGYYIGTYDEKNMTEASVISENWCANVGLSKIQAKNIIRNVCEALQSLKDEAESVFSLYSECECTCVGVFSNGEAIYEKIA